MNDSPIAASPLAGSSPRIFRFVTNGTIARLIELVPLLALDKSVAVFVAALLAGFTDVGWTLHQGDNLTVQFCGKYSSGERDREKVSPKEE
jgi:hypothetical protein